MTTVDTSYSSPMRTAIRPGHALVVAGAIAPTLSVFAYKGLAPLFFLVTVAELAMFWRAHQRLPKPPFSATALVVAFVVWGIAGATWSLDGAASLVTAGKLALMAALALPLFPLVRDLESGERQLILRASRGGVAVGLAFMAVEVLFGLPITHTLYAAFRIHNAIYGAMLNPAATVLVLGAAITAGDLMNRNHPGWALVLGAAAVALAVFSESMAAGLAGVLAAVVLVAAYWGGGAVGRALAVLAALSIMAAPLLPDDVLARAKEFHWPSDAIDSVYQRIGIWEFTAMRIDQKPVLGWGLDAARRIPGGHTGIRAENLHIHDPVMRDRVTRYFNSGNIEQMPLHPHNAALQIWLEAGGIGAALTAALVFVGLLGPVRRQPVNRAGAAAALAFAVAALVIAGLSYGIWQTWWLAVLWLGSLFAALGVVAEAKPLRIAACGE